MGCRCFRWADPLDKTHHRKIWILWIRIMFFPWWVVSKQHRRGMPFFRRVCAAVIFFENATFWIEISRLNHSFCCPGMFAEMFSRYLLPTSIQHLWHGLLVCGRMVAPPSDRVAKWLRGQVAAKPCRYVAWWSCGPVIARSVGCRAGRFVSRQSKLGQKSYHHLQIGTNSFSPNSKWK